MVKNILKSKGVAKKTVNENSKNEKGKQKEEEWESKCYIHQRSFTDANKTKIYSDDWGAA